MTKIQWEHKVRAVQVLLVTALALSTATAAPTAAANATNTPPDQIQAIQRSNRPAETGDFLADAQAAGWTDPDRILPDLVYDSIPVTAVGDDLKNRFGGQFDILYPFGAERTDEWNWEDVMVRLQLKNVKASEVFHAMNLVFEAAKTPLRWELLKNGNRATALLRDLREAKRPSETPTQQSPPPERPMVYFVGDLVGDPQTGGMSMNDVIKTVGEVCDSAAVNPSDRPRIDGHAKAQLLVVRGTEDQIGFVQKTLSALREKARLDGRRPGRKSAEATNRTGETTAP